MADRTLAHEKIEVLWHTVVEAIVADDTGNVSSVRLKNRVSIEESELPCKGVFIAIGHLPNTGPFANAIKVDENGYFVPETGSQVKTNIPGVYVSGDCADHVYRQAITAAGMGCQAAIEAERYLAESD
jgi:thioredoxin reductase (NADPH)